MPQRLRNTRRLDSGFTLVELLVAIVTLGVLAAVVVFAVNGAQNRAKVSACKADVATVTTAGESYFAQRGTYAPDIATLVSNGYLHGALSTTSGYTVTYTVNAAVGGAPATITVGGGSVC
ncbi:MAG: type pilus assembly protein PilA [Nocardioidaceae bacterium]|jgi:general secretion pathway protein G|nr:type pilus assembly protein PilA [Nocardioidaceae bacterium]